jgi:hypothetical protein
MELLTLSLFVLGLLIVAFLVTQSIRHDLKTRQHLSSDLRRDTLQARLEAVERAARQAAIAQQNAHRPPHNSA